MRILYLIDNFSLGGAQTVIKGLMDNGTSGSQNYAIALRIKEPQMTIDHPQAIRFKSRSKYSLRVLRFLKSFIIENSIEILHCQLPRSIITGYLLKRRYPGIRYIIHEQGDIFESRAYSLLLRIISKKADGILVCSEATRTIFIKSTQIEPQKIRVLYNFVDLDRFNPLNRRAFKGVRIAFAGRIEMRKGWRDFVKAALYFRDREELSFYMAGTGTEVKKLIREIKNLKGARIDYVGFISDMKGYYQEMDLVVIPSHFEPMGMVAIEAMACGIPVLAADVPGLNEIVKNQVNGWTFPPESVTELTGAIEKILECSPAEIESIICKGIENSREFSLQRFSGKLQEYYTSLK